MNTIIPNRLSFDLDLNDLPARATQVSPEAMKLSVGSAFVFSLELKYKSGPRVRSDLLSPKRAAGRCREACKSYKGYSKFTCPAKTGGKSYNRYWNCRCSDAPILDPNCVNS